MDLRMVKTRSQIKQAFLTLREKHLPERIKVKDICEMAQINKTTFYNHYTDSFALSEEIDEGALDMVLSHFEEKDKLFESPLAYVTGLFQAIEIAAPLLLKVFRERGDALSAKLEEKLRHIYDGIAKRAEKNVLLSFALGGFVRLAHDYLFAETKGHILDLAQAAATAIASFV